MPPIWPPHAATSYAAIFDPTRMILPRIVRMLAEIVLLSSHTQVEGPPLLHLLAITLGEGARRDKALLVSLVIMSHACENKGKVNLPPLLVSLVVDVGYIACFWEEGGGGVV